jgi:hypothetical protein
MLLAHLQNSYLHYAANCLCEQHHLPDDPPLIPVDQGSIDETQNETQNETVQQNHNRMNAITAKIKFLKVDMKALDSHRERRDAFPLRRNLTTANYIHKPYFVDSSRAARTKEYIDKHRTAEERAEQKRMLRQEEEDKRQLQSQHSSPQHSPRYLGTIPNDEQCYDHDDLGFDTPYWPEDCPKAGEQVQRDL